MTTFRNITRIRFTVVLATFAVAGLAIAAPLPRDNVNAIAILKTSSNIESLAFSPDGKTLASADFESTIQVWDVATRKTVKTLKEAGKFIVFSPDCKSLAVGGDGNEVKIWDLTTLKSRTIHERTPGLGPARVYLSPDGKTLAAGGPCLIRMKVWDVATGKHLHDLPGEMEDGGSLFLAMVATPNNKTLVTTHMSEGLNRWDLATGKLLHTFITDIEVYAAAYSPDAKTVAIASQKSEEERQSFKLQLFDATTGVPGAECKTKELVESLCFSPDGKRLVSGHEASIKFWDVASGRLLTESPVEERFVRCLAFSPDGALLASGNVAENITLWDTSRVK